MDLKGFLLLVLKDNLVLPEEVNSFYSSKELLFLWLKKKEWGMSNLVWIGEPFKVERKWGRKGWREGGREEGIVKLLPGT